MKGWMASIGPAIVSKHQARQVRRQVKAHQLAVVPKLSA
jgi:hypothetical protein